MTTPSDSSEDVEQAAARSGEPRPKRHRSRGQWIALAALVLVPVVGIWLRVTILPKWLTTPDATTTAPPAATPASDARRIQATLFHVSDDGTALVGATTPVTYDSSPSEQLRLLIEAQVRPAPGGAPGPVPEGTTVRAVFITAEHEAYVDLGGTIVSGHPGGSLNEALTVYAIVNAITINLPDITAVQILVDGKEVDSLAGHIDLRHPLTKALDWIAKDTH
jgi:hypothetical protein